MLTLSVRLGEGGEYPRVDRLNTRSNHGQKAARLICISMSFRQIASFNPFVPGMQNIKIRQLIIDCLLIVCFVKRVLFVLRQGLMC